MIFLIGEVIEMTGNGFLEERIINAILGNDYFEPSEEGRIVHDVVESMKTADGKDHIIRMLLEVIDMLVYNKESN